MDLYIEEILKIIGNRSRWGFLLTITKHISAVYDDFEQESVISDVLEEVYYGLKSGDIIINKNLHAYIRTVLKNRCFKIAKEIKKERQEQELYKREIELEITKYFPHVGEFLKEYTIEDIIDNLIANPERFINMNIHGEVFELSFIQRLSNQSAAVVMGIPTENYTQRKSRMINKIKKEIRKRYPKSRPKVKSGIAV